MTMVRDKLAALLCLLLLGPALVRAQGAAAASSAEASTAFEAKDWAKAARLYRELVKEHPEVPRLWIRLAEAQQQLGQPEEALRTMEDGLKAGVPSIFADYLIATGENVFFVKGKEQPFPPPARDDAALEKLWQVSEQLVGLAS